MLPIFPFLIRVKVATLVNAEKRLSGRGDNDVDSKCRVDNDVQDVNDTGNGPAINYISFLRDGMNSDNLTRGGSITND